MALLRLIAEGVGPFKRLDLDFSDGNGNPRLGPHILAGVNGSGKSTVLRAIARAAWWTGCGFDREAWQHLISGQEGRVLAIVSDQVTGSPYPMSYGGDRSGNLVSWVDGEIRELQRLMPRLALRYSPTEGDPNFNIAAYAPSLALSYVDAQDMTTSLDDPWRGSLAFHDTVQNTAIQAWLLRVYSKRAIARERSESAEHYTRSLSRFESALNLLYGEDVRLEVEIEPDFQPRLRMRNRALNFSQLPDSVRNTVGWVADFMMRQDLFKWTPELGERRPGVLLLDEVDAHLHPRWQRLLLPAMRKALPDVQIVATSHSPFVISSCAHAVIHVLEVNSEGVATNRPPAPAPVGESITTTLKDVFGVESRFDVQTEHELNEWNDLTRRVAAGKISPADRNRLSELTATLSERSEELRSIVGTTVRSSEAVLDALLHR